MIISNVGTVINAYDGCKELINKVRCDDGFIQYPIICICERKKSYDVTNYENKNGNHMKTVTVEKTWLINLSKNVYKIDENKIVYNLTVYDYKKMQVIYAILSITNQNIHNRYGHL